MRYEELEYTREAAEYHPVDLSGYIVMRYDPSMDCLIVKPRRRFSWMKKTRPSTLKAQVVSEGEKVMPIVGGFDQMGIDFIRDAYADYDTGFRYVVLETVADLEWAVIDADTMTTVKKVSLDFDEAKRYCDDINQSEKEIWNA